MDWLESEISFLNKQSGHPVVFKLVHFDCVDYPAIANSVRIETHGTLSIAETELGSVLWTDAISLFLPYLSTCKFVGGTAVCLGEGTGACGCGLSAFFDKVYISDLPKLLPLLELNASKSLHKNVSACIVDWQDDCFSVDVHAEVIIGCEVLYGNRFVWPHLMKTICKFASRNTAVYLCVTFRNGRHDIDDFNNQYLSKHFQNVSEISLSENVSVLKGTCFIQS